MMRWSRKNRVALGLVAAAILWTTAGASFLTYKAAKHVSQASMFVGGDSDLRWLVRLPGTESWFFKLTSGDSPAGRLYGACGLYLVGSSRFGVARANLTRD